MQEWLSPGRTDGFDSYMATKTHVAACVNILQKLNVDRFDEAIHHVHRLTPQEAAFVHESPLLPEAFHNNLDRYGTYYCFHCAKSVFNRNSQTLCMKSRSVLDFIKHWTVF